MEQQELCESVLTITYVSNVTLFSCQLGHRSLGRSDESSVSHNISLMTLPISPFAAVSLAAWCGSENIPNRSTGAPPWTGQQERGAAAYKLNLLYRLFVSEQGENVSGGPL